MSASPVRLLEAAFEASPDAVLIVDDRGVVRLASPAVEALFGYRPGELVGEPVEVLLPGDRRPVHIAHRARYAADPTARPMGEGLDLQGRRRDGTTFPVDISLAPTVVDGRRWTGAFVRDVTDRRRGELGLRFVNEISQHLLAGRATAENLRLVARRARNLVDAASAWVVVPDDGDRRRLVVAAADGHNEGELVGATLSADASLSARTIANASPLLVADMSTDAEVLAEARASGLGPGAYLPMLAETRVVGTLVVARQAGRPPFGQAELAALSVFASAAAVVLSLGRARDEVEALQLVADRERIARDLHDTVIQRLFAVGMSLQGVERLADEPVAGRVRQSVDVIDEVIREIRETIFELGRPAYASNDLRRQTRAVVAEAAGTDPHLTVRVAFRGPVESSVGSALAAHVLSVVREGVSNVARHAAARSAEVVVEATGEWLTVNVVDDGAGLPESASAGNGLANLTARAEELDGSLTVAARPGGGTALRWRVPLGAGAGASDG